MKTHTYQTHPGAQRPFGRRDKLGYLIGNAANDFTFVFASLYLQVFYTDVLGINAAVVGTMFLLARIVDAVTDTVMGRIADKTPAGKGGKFKPWLLRVSGPVALASFLMYQSSLAGAIMPIKIAYMFVTYLLWGSIFYTAINIPYGSMASVISRDPDHRSSLSAFRGIGSMIPQIVIGVILPTFIYTTRPDGTKAVNAEAFPVVALVLSVAAIGGYLLCYALCTERVKPTERITGQNNVGIKDALKTMANTRSLIAICLVFVFFLAAQMLSQTISNYIFKDYFANTAGLTVMNAVGFVPMLVLAPLAVPLARRFGKKELGVFASVLGTVAFAFLFLVRTENMWLYVAVNILGVLGFGLINLIIWAYISDVIDDHELHTGTRQDGMIYAVCSFARKLGQAIASGIGGWSLAWIGYVEGSAVGQTDAVRNGIYTVATLTPAILYLLVSLTLFFLYPLGKKRVEENTHALQAAHGKAQAEDASPTATSDDPHNTEKE